MTDTTLITGGLVVTGEPPAAVAADVLVEGGRIAAIEPAGTIDASRGKPLDATDRMIVPGLCNGHTHSHGSLGKGLVGDRVPLEVFLTGAVSINGNRTMDDKRLSATLTAVELVRKGCTATFDMFTEVPAPSPEGVGAVAAAYAEVGIRAVVAPMMADRTLYTAFPGLLDSLPEPWRTRAAEMRTAPWEESVAACRRVLEGWREDREMVRPGIAPTIPLHCSDEFMVACGRLSEAFDVPFQTHLAETKTQNLMGVARYGKSLTEHLDDLGLLTERFSAAHGIWLSGEDMKRIGERGGAVVHNPMSNLRLGSGIARARLVMEAGARLAVGTDATNCSDGQNMFEALRLATNLSRIADPDPARWLSAEEVFRAATVESAAVMGFEKVGRLAPGWAADMVFLDLAHINYVPLRAPLLQMVLAENGAAVHSVMVAGRMVLEAGRLLTVDEARLRREAEGARDRLDAMNAEARKAADALGELVGCFCLAHARTPLAYARRLPEEAL